MTHKEFIDRVYNTNEAYRNGEFQILSEYKNMNSLIRVSDKFGELELAARALVEGYNLTIKSAVDKHKYFINYYFNLYPDRTGTIEFLDEYVNSRTQLRVKVKYGICLTYPDQLLSGRFPTIKSAIDKHDFFLNRLLDTNPHYKEGKFEVIGIYECDRCPIEVRNQYGIVKILPSKLYDRGVLPDINGAVDKDEYWTNQAKEVHGNLYSYFPQPYIEGRDKIKIVCPTHGEFEVTRGKHLSGDGCRKCGYERVSIARAEEPTGWSCTKWIEASKKCKKFDSFKVYIVRCFSETEAFYKIGRTYHKVRKRFHGIPYEHEVLEIIESEDAKLIFEIERDLKNSHSEFKYKPNIKFHGSHECFTKLNMDIIYGFKERSSQIS